MLPRNALFLVIREQGPDPSWPQTFRDVLATVTQDTSGHQPTQAGGVGSYPQIPNRSLEACFQGPRAPWFLSFHPKTGIEEISEVRAEAGPWVAATEAVLHAVLRSGPQTSRCPCERPPPTPAVARGPVQPMIGPPLTKILPAGLKPAFTALGA